MLGANIIPHITTGMLILGCVLSIVALTMDSWGKLDPVTVSQRLGGGTISGNWGLFKLCVKKITQDDVVGLCKSLDNYPAYLNAVIAFEILAVLCSAKAFIFWCVWTCWKKPPQEHSFPWPKVIKMASIVLICLTAFWHAVAVAVWKTKDVGPEIIRKYPVTSGFSWGFAIFCIVWELLILIPVQLSLPAYKRANLKQTPQQPHPLFQPDPDGGGIVIGKEVVERGDHASGYLNRPAPDTMGRRTFVDSLPDERNVYVYDEDEGAIKPQTISRTAGRQTAAMMGRTWGRQEPKKQEKSRLQQMKETWSKREGFKFGFGTKSKADNADGIEGESEVKENNKKSRDSAGPSGENGDPLFVKSLWKTHFKKDTIEDDYKVDNDNRISANWAKGNVKNNTRKNYNESENEEESEEERESESEEEEEDIEEIDSDEVDEINERVYTIPSSSEDEGEKVVTVPNPNISFQKTKVKRESYNTPNDETNNLDENYSGFDTQDIPSNNNNTPSSNFSFKEKVVQRRNYNVPSDDEIDKDDEEESPVPKPRKKRQAPGTPIHSESRLSNEESGEPYDMYGNDTGFDPPGFRIRGANMPPLHRNDRDESDGERPKSKAFAFLSDMVDNDENVTDI